MFIDICLLLSTYLYIYICIHIYTYIYIHIHTYITLYYIILYYITLHYITYIYIYMYICIDYVMYWSTVPHRSQRSLHDSLWIPTGGFDASHTEGQVLHVPDSDLYVIIMYTVYIYITHKDIHCINIYYNYIYILKKRTYIVFESNHYFMAVWSSAWYDKNHQLCCSLGWPRSHHEGITAEFCCNQMENKWISSIFIHPLEV